MEKNTPELIVTLLGIFTGKLFAGIWLGAGFAFGWWLIGHFFGLFG